MHEPSTSPRIPVGYELLRKKHAPAFLALMKSADKSTTMIKEQPDFIAAINCRLRSSITTQ